MTIAGIDCIKVESIDVVGDEEGQLADAATTKIGPDGTESEAIDDARIKAGHVGDAGVLENITDQISSSPIDIQEIEEGHIEENRNGPGRIIDIMAPTSRIDGIGPNEEIVVVGASEVGALGGGDEAKEMPNELKLEAIDFRKVDVDRLSNEAFGAKLREITLKKIGLERLGGGSEIAPEEYVNAIFRIAEEIADFKVQISKMGSALAYFLQNGSSDAELEIIGEEDPVRRSLLSIESKERQVFGVKDLRFGPNWYADEGSNDNCWRWAGPGLHSTIMIPSGNIARGLLALNINTIEPQSLKDAFEEIRPTFFLDHECLEFTLPENSDKASRGTITARFNRRHGRIPSHFVLHIYFDQLQYIRDVAGISTGDTRKLGICLRSIEVRPTNGM